MAEQVTWYGSSGTGYSYTVYPLDQTWADVPGNYIFAKVVDGKWFPIYIGETGSLSDRLGPHHEKWTCGLREGMTHIHAHGSSESVAVRRAEESDLLANRNPPCND